MERDPMNLNRLAYFAAVVEAASFTRAAERLGVGKAVVSQQVARLEQEIGVTLLLRTTRKVQPTEAGRTLHARCLVILKESAEAFDEIGKGTLEPRGVLRVTAPFDYGATVVVGVMTAFTRMYPHCDVELSLTDRLVDVQDVDLAIRVGSLRDSSDVMRRIGTMEQHLVCSKDLAARLLRVRDPEDLEGLPFISNGSLTEPNVWRFTHPKRGVRTARMHARITVDATPVVHALVQQGAGMSVLPDYLVATEVKAGALVRVLPDWKLRSGGIHVVLPSTRFRPAKVTRFLELLTLRKAA